jgi:hypothetical protein
MHLRRGILLVQQVPMDVAPEETIRVRRILNLYLTRQRECY